jgi:hypothetical protein
MQTPDLHIYVYIYIYAYVCVYIYIYLYLYLSIIYLSLSLYLSLPISIYLSTIGRDASGKPRRPNFKDSERNKSPSVVHHACSFLGSGRSVPWPLKLRCTTSFSGASPSFLNKAGGHSLLLTHTFLLQT